LCDKLLSLRLSFAAAAVGQHVNDGAGQAVQDAAHALHATLQGQRGAVTQAVLHAAAISLLLFGRVLGGMRSAAAAAALLQLTQPCYMRAREVLRLHRLWFAAVLAQLLLPQKIGVCRLQLFCAAQAQSSSTM
jgi:hypothetical protein